MEFAFFDMNTLVTIAVGAILCYVLYSDMTKRGKTTGSTELGPKPATAPKKEATEESKDASEAKDAKATEGAKDLADEKKESPQEAPAAKEERVSEKDAQLADMLDDVFDELDVEENMVDQAWDSLENNRQVSTHVNEYNDFLKNSMDTMSKALHNAKQRKKEEESARVRAAKYNAEGLELAEQKRYSEAVQSYSSALRLVPDSHKDKALFYCNRGQTHMDMGRLRDAIADADACTKLNPSYYDAYKLKALVFEQRSEWALATQKYQEIIKRFPTMSTIKHARAGIERCNKNLVVPDF